MSHATLSGRLVTTGRLLRYAVPYWRYWTLLLLTMGLSIGLELLLPWPTKFLVDHVLAGQPAAPWVSSVLAALTVVHGRDGLLVLVCVSTVAIIVASTLVNTGSDYIRVALGHRLAYQLGGDVLLQLERLPVQFHNGRQLGDMVARVTEDAHCVQMILIGVAVPFLQSTAFIVGTSVILWRMQPSMALLSLAVIPFLAGLVVCFDERMRSPCQLRRENEARMASIVQQTLSALTMVQAFNREEFQHELYRRCAHETVASHQRAVVVDARFKTLTCLITSCGLATTIWFGARHVLDGRLTVGDILVMLVYVQAMLGPIRLIAESTSTWQVTSVCADRVAEVMNARLAVTDVPGAQSVPLSGCVRFEHVCFAYTAEQQALKGIDLEARPGETVAIVGPTGAGKTTLVNLLLRLHDPTAGRITIDGHDLRTMRVKALRDQISVVLQQPFILSGTVADNIRYGQLGASRDEVVQAAICANADEFIRRLPMGYDTVISEQGNSLSGGERQRLAIARAFIKNAPILVLDEPTSALDARAESTLVEAIERLRRGRTTFIIAHRFSTIRGVDQICVLDHGRVVEHGKHEDLVASGGLYMHLYATQAGGLRPAAESTTGHASRAFA